MYATCTGCPMKKVSMKNFLGGAAQGFNSQFFEVIWIQYICKFCSVYHLIDLDAPR